MPEAALKVRIAFLPPMSGLIAQEDLLQPGSIDRRIGEGRTADVLRNLCYLVYDRSTANDESWAQLTGHMRRLFGIILHPPHYDQDTGILSLRYSEQEQPNIEFDLNASGQGLRQTLLLLSYLYLNPNTVLLLDEPDAHLEILRQRQIYNTFADLSMTLSSQIIIATHSEVILDEAAQRGSVVAFIGKPHTVSKATHVRKALAEYGYDDCAQAEQTGWVLYLEGATDYEMLRKLAARLRHPAEAALQRPFLHYVANQPKRAEAHFYAMREAFPSLEGIALFDRLERLPEQPNFPMLMWQRRELENYIAHPDALRAFAVAGLVDDMFAYSHRQVMDRLIEDNIPAGALRDWEHRYWVNTKISDELLAPLFEAFYAELRLPNEIRKSGYYRLADYLPDAMILPEIIEKLDAIADAAVRGAEQRQIWQERIVSDDSEPADDTLSTS